MSKILVTGADGMIGKELVILLKEQGHEVIEADIKSGYDLREYEVCDRLMYDIDYCYHLMGIKGNPKMTNEKPLDFMLPMLQCDTNIIRTCIENKVKKMLYTSSIAVEHPEEDKYPAWAKMTAETLLEAAKIQYPYFKSVVVRPCNVYGRFDNFNKEHLMVISDLIRKAKANPTLDMWGDGSSERDFINAKDCARGMIQAMEGNYDKPLNLCSGEGVTIRTVAEIIAKEFGKEITYDLTKPTGSKRRVMELNWDFKPTIGIEEGIKEVIKCQL